MLIIPWFFDKISRLWIAGIWQDTGWSWQAPHRAGWPIPTPNADRISSVGLSDHPSRQRPDASSAAQAGVGALPCQWQPLRPRLHGAATQEDRGRSLATSILAHGSGYRLPVCYFSGHNLPNPNAPPCFELVHELPRRDKRACLFPVCLAEWYEDFIVTGR